MANGRPASSAPTSAGGTTTPTTAQGVAKGRALRWSPCGATQGPSGYQCATLQVPLDYAHPSRGTIGIALDRHVATGTPIGSLLVNPGGPGVSGVDYLPDIVAELQPDMLARFNIVGFDPRGVGRSDPVTCGTGSQLDAELSVDPAPTTKARFASLVAADRRFVAGCKARSGSLLPYVGTVEAATDMDRIRIALGEPKLDYLGFSYGTYLGAVYARMFPTHIRAMVLDGAIDPALSAVATVDAQSAALERELTAFFAACSKGECGWKPSSDLSADFQALLAKVRAHPVTVAGSTQQVNAAVLLYGAAAALYSPQEWTTLGQALTALGQGQGSPILALFDNYLGRASNGTYSNEIEAETAVDCADGPVPNLSGLRADAGAAEKGAPVFGLLDLYSEATCSIWPVKVTTPRAPITAAGSPPIVVVGSTDDPITPYAWAKALAGQLANGVLLTRSGYGHTAYGFSSCIRSRVDNYFIGLAVPPKGTVCPSD